MRIIQVIVAVNEASPFPVANGRRWSANAPALSLPAATPLSRTNDVLWRTNDVRWRTNNVRWRPKAFAGDLKRINAFVLKWWIAKSALGFSGSVFHQLQADFESFCIHFQEPGRDFGLQNPKDGFSADDAGEAD